MVKDNTTTEKISEQEDQEVLDVDIVDASADDAASKGPNAKEKYFEAVGRRKTAVARVRLLTRKSSDADLAEGRSLIIVNKKPYFEYFNEPEMQNTIEEPLKKLKSLARFKATVLVKGGGITGQAEATRLGLSRALVLFDENFSKKFKKSGYLTRDPREKERRKYGLKKARKSPRWSKR